MVVDGVVARNGERESSSFSSVPQSSKRIEGVNEKEEKWAKDESARGGCNRGVRNDCQPPHPPT